LEKEIRIGTRGSKLALWQAHWVKYSLERFVPDYRYRIVTIKTVGDRNLETPLAQIGDKGLFTKELEQALLSGEIHMAVHSMKDLPVVLPTGLALGAVCPREMPNDVVVSRSGQKLEELPGGAVVGTGSLRRRAQLAHLRPDLVMADIRGNLDTRITKLDEGLYDAVILAWAGMKRMEMINRITEVISPDICLPAVGQGAIGVEIPADNPRIREVVGHIDHRDTHLAIAAERALLGRVEGGCHAPVGSLGTVALGHLLLVGMVASLDGQRVVRSSVTGKAENAAAIGAELGEKLLGLGAQEILDEIKRESCGYDA